jgi:hypothetical protein
MVTGRRVGKKVRPNYSRERERAHQRPLGQTLLAAVLLSVITTEYRQRNRIEGLKCWQTRAGLRGGAGRTRTSNQMVMSVPSSRQLGPSYFSGTSRCQGHRDQQGRQSRRVADASPRNRHLTDFDVLSRRPWDIPTVDSFFCESSQGRKMDMSE